MPQPGMMEYGEPRELPGHWPLSYGHRNPQHLGALGGNSFVPNSKVSEWFRALWPLMYIPQSLTCLQALNLFLGFSCGVSGKESAC